MSAKPFTYLKDDFKNFSIGSVMFTHLKPLINHNTAYRDKHSEVNMKTKK